MEKNVGGVYSAREQDSSVGGGTGYNCLGVVHMEEECSGQGPCRNGKRKSKVKERHTEKDKARNRRNKQTLNRSSYMA